MKKIWSKVEKHTSSDAHKHSVTFWAGYKQAATHGTVGDQLSSERARVKTEIFEVNLCVLFCVADKTMFKRAS